MCDIPNSSYSAKGITEKIFTPFWSPSDGNRKPMKTFGVYFGSLKTFLLSVNLKTFA